LKIAVVNSFYSPDIVGGAEVASQGLAEGLVMQGHKVRVFSLGQVSELAQLDGVENQRFEPGNRYWPALPWATVSGPLRSYGHIQQLYDRKLAIRVCDAIYEFNPDIIHLHNVVGFSAALYDELSNRNLRVPIVQTLHDYWLACIKNTLLNSDGEICEKRPMLCKLRSHWLKSRMRCVDYFISPSEFLAEYLSRIKIVPKGNVAVIHNGIRSSNISRESVASHRTEHRSRQHTNVLFLGQLVRNKGISVLLDAAALVRASNISIKIAGTGPLVEQVAASKHISYLGVVSGDAKEQALLDADVLVVPSVWYENNPLSILEGFQYGLAICGSRIGGIPELVLTGENGQLVEPALPTDLASALRTLAADRGKLHEHQLQSLEMSKRFTLDRFIADHLRLFERISSPAAAP
jgi:glycosyltransferase involved in cell wall biosynthesis